MAPEISGRKISSRRLLSFEDLHERGIRYTRVHLARLEAAGLFPQRVRIGGGNYIAWLESEIDAYVDGLAATRSTKRRGRPVAGTHVESTA
jgi:prophage regulatory protein